MSKQQILMVVALCFVLIGTVAAGIPHEPKPDSIVVCKGDGEMGVVAATVPLSVNRSECSSFEQSCSPCIRSLENQGCEVVDLVTEFIPPLFSSLPERGVFQSATFQLSCESP